MVFVIKELPSDTVEMCLVELQNPSTMWLVDIINKQMSKKFYELEERLKEVLERGKPQYCNRMLNVGDIVGVHDSVSGAWCRAKICDIYQKLAKYVYSVFLVDRGYSITSDPMNVKELPPEASTVQFRCYHIQLYGIVPISRPNTIASPENVELQSWLPEAIADVRKMLNTCEAVYFTPKVARRTVYGDIYLKFDYGFINLADYLCDNKFAIYNTNSFDLMMETAPYMSCQQGFCANGNKENRSISDYIKINQAADETLNCQEENGSPNQCSDYEQDPLEHTSENKLVENDGTISSQKNTKGSQRRTSALQQYYEEMRQADRHHSGVGDRTSSGKEVGSRQIAQKRHFPSIGRGERLQMLQRLSAGKKPGGSCSKSLSDNARDKFEDEDVLVDELSNMSINGNRSPACTEPQFFGRNVFMNNVSDGKRTRMDSPREPSQSDAESNGNIFCRPSKLMFLPAGSEASMLVAKKKERRGKRHPHNFTGKDEINSSNNFREGK